MAARRARGDVAREILRALSLEPMHGYALMQLLDTGPGTIYPNLKKLTSRKLIRLSDTDGLDDRKLYELTDAGARAAEPNNLQSTTPRFAGNTVGPRPTVSGVSQ